MTILLLGARGFIGARIAAALEARVLAVEAGTRDRYDLAASRDAAAWRRLVAGHEAVVNAAGVFSGDEATLQAIHERGPSALFEACAAEGIPVVQVSALGAAPDAATAFLRTKGRADAKLLALGGPCAIFRPSLVFGDGGRSAELFSTLASLPVIAVPEGAGRIQPVHVDDLAQAVARCVAERRYDRSAIDAVGPRAMTVDEYLVSLRKALGRGTAPVWTVPRSLVALAARMRVGLLDADALCMLEAGSVSDPRPFEAALGRPAKTVDRFIEPAARASWHRRATLGWMEPVLRASIAFVWIATGVISAGLFPEGESRALLARVGLEGGLATLALYGASALDFALGLATLFVRRRMLWLLQLVLMGGYTAIITVFLPEQWLHPFGPVVKNVPLAAAILLMHQLERR